MKGKTKNPILSHERVREALDYNPDTGIFVWKINSGYNYLVGTTAGGKPNKQGYSSISLDRVEVTLGRLAWFYVKGEWPERRIRYVNGDPTDNRFANLTQYNGLAGEFDHRTREGRLAYQVAYRKLTPKVEKARSLRESFGLTLEQYEEMHDRQDGKCAICGSPETQKRSGKLKALAVDHCHASGKIRELLCTACNQGLGKFKDNPVILQKAIEYLTKHSPDATSAPEEHPGILAPSTGPADTARTMGRNLVQEEG